MDERDTIKARMKDLADKIEYNSKLYYVDDADDKYFLVQNFS